MLKLLLKVISFVVIFAVLSNLCSYVILSSQRLSNFFEVYKVGPEVYEAIIKSKKHSKCATVVLGDSVAKQLFSESDDDATLNLTTNAAISMAGQYALVDNVIKSNKDIKQIYLVINPFAFINNLNDIYTYSYFVKPFYNNEYRNLFTPRTSTIIDSKLYSYAYSLPITRILPLFGNIDYTKPLKRASLISDTSIEYLKLIGAMCSANNIRFRVVPAPISMSKAPVLHKSIKDAESLIIRNSLQHTFTQYFENVQILPDDVFVDDLVHIKPGHLAGISNEVLSKYGFERNAVDFTDGFYDEERSGAKKFRWVGSSASFNLNTPAGGKYRVEFAVVNPRENELKLNIHCDGQALTETAVPSSTFESPRTVAFEFDSCRPQSTIKLAALGTRVKFPGDARDIAFGMYLPVKVISLGHIKGVE